MTIQKSARRKRRQLRNRLAGLGCLTVFISLVVVIAVWVKPLERLQQLLQPGGGGPPSGIPGWQDVPVRRDSVSEAVQAYGMIMPLREVKLAFQTARGRVDAVLAAPGMPVVAGQPLVELDRAALERDLATARAELLEAQEKLDELRRAGSATLRIELEVELATQRTALDEARRALAAFDAGDDTPRARRAAAAAELERARTALAVLREDRQAQEQINYLQWIYNQAEVKHGEMASLPSPSEKDRDVTWLLRNEMLDKREALEGAKLQRQINLRQAEQAVARAERALQRLDRELALGSQDIERIKRVAAVTAAEAAVRQTQARLDALGESAPDLEVARAEAEVLKREFVVQDAEAALADATLVAPFDGLIVEISALPNMTIAPGMPLVTIQDTSEWRIVAQVSEIDIGRLQAGMRARVMFDAFMGQPPLEGQLGEIPLYGQYQAGITMFSVPILVDIGEFPLMQGMTANISIPLRTKENVLTLPAAAIQYDPEGAFVWLVQGDRTELRRVEIGLNDGILVEIVSGLNEGDVVRAPMFGPYGPMGPVMYSIG